MRDVHHMQQAIERLKAEVSTLTTERDTLTEQVERVRELATNRAISVCDVYGNTYAAGMLRAADVLSVLTLEGE